MTVFSIVAFHVFLMGNAYALSDNQTFTIKAPSTQYSCGLRALVSEGMLGDEFTYEVEQNAPSNLDAYVNITHWEVGENLITPAHAYLHNIAYQFGDYGRQVPFNNRESKKVRMTFSLKKRKDLTLPSTVTHTKLTMTVTCFDAYTDEYTKAQDFWSDNGQEEQLEWYNKSIWFHNDFGIFTPSYPHEAGIFE